MYQTLSFQHNMIEFKTGAAILYIGKWTPKKPTKIRVMLKLDIFYYWDKNHIRLNTHYKT